MSYQKNMEEEADAPTWEEIHSNIGGEGIQQMYVEDELPPTYDSIAEQNIFLDTQKQESITISNTSILNFKGRDGIDGKDGRDGKDARVYPEVGGNGQHGTDGTDGRDGKNIEIRLKFKHQTETHIRFLMSYRSELKDVTLEKGEEVLFINATGGNGGKGGDGGRPGNGIEKQSFDGKKRLRSEDGDHGSAGRGGNGGDGGNVKLIVNNPALLNFVVCNVKGGRKGRGGIDGNRYNTASDGRAGRDGKCTFIYQDFEKNIQEIGESKSNLKIKHFCLTPLKSDGVIEPGEILTISSINVYNEGDIRSSDVSIQFESHDWVGQTVLNIPEILPNQSIDLNCNLRGCFKLRNQILEQNVHESIMTAKIYESHFDTGKSTFGYIKLQYPIEANIKNRSKVLNPNEETVLDLNIRNISTEMYGLDKSISWGCVEIQIKLPRSLSFVNQKDQFMKIFPHVIKAKETLTWKIEIRMNQNVDSYESSKIEFKLILRDTLINIISTKYITVPIYNHTTLNNHTGVCIIARTSKMSKNSFFELDQFLHSFSSVKMAYMDLSHELLLLESFDWMHLNAKTIVFADIDTQQLIHSLKLLGSDFVKKISQKDNGVICFTDETLDMKEIIQAKIFDSTYYSFLNRDAYTDYFFRNPTPEDMQNHSDTLIEKEIEKFPGLLFEIKENYSLKKHSGGMIRTCYSYGTGTMYKLNFDRTNRFFASDSDFPVLCGKSVDNPNDKQFETVFKYLMSLPLKTRISICTESPSYYQCRFISSRYSFHDVAYMSLLYPIIREYILLLKDASSILVKDMVYLKQIMDLSLNEKLSKEEFQVIYSIVSLFNVFYDEVIRSNELLSLPFPSDLKEKFSYLSSQFSNFNINERPKLCDFNDFHIDYVEENLIIRDMMVKYTTKPGFLSTLYGYWKKWTS